MEVEADLVRQDRNDAFLEQIVSRLSLKPEVSAVTRASASQNPLTKGFI